jgi:hypothetical protein
MSDYGGRVDSCLSAIRPASLSVVINVSKRALSNSLVPAVRPGLSERHVSAGRMQQCATCGGHRSPVLRLPLSKTHDPTGRRDTFGSDAQACPVHGWTAQAACIRARCDPAEAVPGDGDSFTGGKVRSVSAMGQRVNAIRRNETLNGDRGHGTFCSTKPGALPTAASRG